MDFEEEVKAHTQRVERGERVRYGQACPCCGAAKEELFRLHDRRRRKFRLVVQRYVQVACRFRPGRGPLSRPLGAGAVVVRWGERCNAAGRAGGGDGEEGVWQPGRDEGGDAAKIEGGGVKGQLAGGGPEVERVAVGAAGEAVVKLAGKMD
jgi:hypothetical protein